MMHQLASREELEAENLRLRRELADEKARSSGWDLGEAFRRTLEDAQQAAAILEPSGMLRHANRTALELLGMPASQIVGLEFWNIPWLELSTTDRETLRDAVLRTARGENVCFGTTRRTRHGDEQPFEFSLRPIRNDDRQVVALIAEAWEITGGTQAEKTIERTRLLLDSVLDQSPVAMLVVSSPYIVVRYINQAAVEMLGIGDEPSLVDLPLGEIRKRQTWQDLTPESGLPIQGLPLELALQGRSTRNIECGVLRKDGTRAWLVAGAAPIHDRNGNILAGVLVFRDVTEAKNSEQEIRRLAEEQRTILDTATTGICLLKAEHIEWVNSAFSTMFGFNSEELKGLDTRRFYANQQDYEQVHREGYQSLTPGRVYTAELPMRRRSGETFWCSISGGSVDPQRMEKGTIWVLQDITERRLAEEALRRSEVRLDAAQAQACIGSWELGLDHTCGFWSNQMFRLFNLEPCSQSPALADFLEMVHPDDRDAFQQAHRKVLHSGLPATVEYRSNPARGAIRTFCANIKANTDATGKIENLAGTLQDITERHQTEEALRLSEARLEAAQAQAQIGSWEFDITTKTHFWSKEMYRLSGLNPQAGSPSPSELTDDLIHPADREQTRQTLKEAIALGSRVSCEFRSNPSRGPVRVLTASLQAFRDSSGSVTSLSGTLQDITELSRLHEQLQEASKMEAVGRLAGGVAHDFNNLLTVISGNTELARLELARSDPLAQYLEEVSNAATSAAELTRQLLAFSRRQIIAPKVVNLNELIGNLRRMLNRLLGEDLALETTLAEELGSVRVDPGQFDQVIVNLAINARDAMPDGGRLLIETANVELDEAYCRQHADLNPGEFVLLAVSDTGQGMSAEVRRRIFEPFFTTKPKGRGTGLGLAMIFGVVKQAGGRIEVYSEIGHGTTFKIYLPRVDEPAEKLSRSGVTSDLPRGNETVLLVEDDASVRELSAVFLKRHGYKVIVAPNGGEAFLQAEKRKEPIDLMLTDVVMPGMNGRELAERIRQIHPETAVIFTSGYTEDMIVRRGVINKHVHFISKPYSMQAIVRKVRQVLDDQTWKSA